MTIARWLSVSMALLLTGCVQAQIADLRKRCDFTNDPRFESLRGKVPLSPTQAESPPTLAEISNNGRPTAGGPVAELVGIEGGVVSGVFNLESSDVGASDRRPRHEERYHEV